MRSIIRVAVALIAGVGTFYFVFWVPFLVIVPAWRSLWIRIPASLFCALIVAQSLWRRSTPGRRGLARSVGRGALVTGVIGFSAGFFGPMIFAPGGAQGPLLGILITGPLGLLLGGIGGGFYWLTRRNQVDQTPDDGTRDV